MALFKRSGIPEVEELTSNSSFRLVLELDFDDMIPFVISNIRKTGMFSSLYMFLNLFTLVALILLIVYGFLQGWITWMTLIKQFLLGLFAGSILVIPVHELFHGLAYRILGARNIHFGADLQQLIFFVTADRYTIDRKELYFLALLPFAVINVSVLILLIWWVPHLYILFGVFLLAHNLMCIGDFAIVNFAQKSEGDMFSFDEVEKKKSYFFVRSKTRLL
jgi:hypothetical protein